MQNKYNNLFQNLGAIYVKINFRIPAKTIFIIVLMSASSLIAERERITGIILDIGFGQGKILDNRKLESQLNDNSFDNSETHLHYANITTSQSRRLYEYYELANPKPSNFQTKSFRFGLEFRAGSFGIGISFQNLNVVADNYLNQELKPVLFPKNELNNQIALIELYSYRNHNTNVINVFNATLDLVHHFSSSETSDLDPYVRFSLSSSKYSPTYSYAMSTGIRYNLLESYGVFGELYMAEHRISQKELRINRGYATLFSDFEEPRYFSFRDAGLRFGGSKLFSFNK